MFKSRLVVVEHIKAHVLLLLKEVIQLEGLHKFRITLIFDCLGFANKHEFLRGRHAHKHVAHWVRLGKGIKIFKFATSNKELDLGRRSALGKALH